VDASDAEQVVEDRLDVFLHKHHRTPAKVFRQPRVLQSRERGDDFDERVRLGEISTREFEQLTGLLDAERLGLTERVYDRRPHAVGALARKIGVSATDAHSEPLDVSQGELLGCAAVCLEYRAAGHGGGAHAVRRRRRRGSRCLPGLPASPCKCWRYVLFTGG
jgi:hypothetical protein